MAAYQGARRQSIFFPGRAFSRRVAGREVAAPPRRRVRAAVRARRRPSRVGVLLGGIALVFVLAFFSLSQTMRVSATSYDIDRLAAERESLEAQRTELQSDLNRLGREPAVRKLALDAGLGQLTAPIVLPAR
jgi:cell division protein FtsL